MILGLFSVILGFLGVFCVIAGIVTITEVIPPLGETYTWEFWFLLAIVFLLASIATIVGGRGREE